MNQKKKYIKPALEFVNFVLSSSIAGTCTYKGTSTNADSCGYLDNEYVVYSSQTICDIIMSDKNSFCYHTPTADTSVFDS